VLSEVKVQSTQSKKLQIIRELGRRKMSEHQFKKDFENGWIFYDRNLNSREFKLDPFNFAIDSLESCIHHKKSLIEKLELLK